MAMSLSDSRGLQAEPNVTPLIDVLLVLLMIFMVIVPITPRGLEALLPQKAPPGQVAPDSTTILQILAGPAGPSYRLNEQPFANRAELSAALSRKASLRAHKVLFVRGDPALDFAAVADVIDLSRSLGIRHVAILTPQISSH